MKKVVDLWMRAGIKINVELDALEDKTPQEIEQEVANHLSSLQKELFPILRKYGLQLDGDSYVPQEALEEAFKPVVSKEKLNELLTYTEFNFEF